MGVDTFLLTKDVCAALINHGFVNKISINSQTDLRLVEGAFKKLQQQSGRPLCEISKILALSTHN